MVILQLIIIRIIGYTKKHFTFPVHTVTPIDNIFSNNFIAKYSAWALSTTTSIIAGKNKTKQNKY